MKDRKGADPAGRAGGEELEGEGGETRIRIYFVRKESISIKG